MAKLKQRILDEARKLFVEKGYESVSLRTIAEAAGTTIGNLTYHYPHKENLVQAIQQSSQDVFREELVDMIRQGGASLENLVTMLNQSQENHERNAFYFRNMINLCKDFAPIAHSAITFREYLFDFFLSCFRHLRDEGLMRADITDDRYVSLAYTVLLMSSVWLQSNSLSDDPNLPKIKMAKASFDIIYPFFTAAGRARFDELTAG